MSKAPSKAPSRAPGVPSTAAHPSKVPLPPTQAPMSARPSASTGSQVPSRMPSIVPRIEVVSPSQVPIPASVVPLPSLTPSAAAARLPSKTPLPSRVPASVRPPTITPSSRIPGQGHSVASSAVPRVSTYASFRGPPPSLPAITETTPSSHRASAAPGPAVSSSSSSSYFLSPSVIPREVATAATFATAIPPSSTIPAGAGAGGPTLKSVYRNPEDLRRAQMQTTYNTLTPAERADQDAWATHKADEFAPCPFNFAWERDDHYPGVSSALVTLRVLAGKARQEIFFLF